MVFNELVAMFGKVMGDGFDIKIIKPETDLFQDLGVDSITMLMMGIAIEEKFDIKLSTSDINECRLVSDIVAIIEKHLKEK